MMTKTIYYQNSVGTIRDSIKDDCYELAKRMRQSDKDEVWASNRLSPIEATLECLRASTICMTIERNGFAVAMFGITPKDLIGNSACIWLLSTDGILGIGRVFVRNSRWIIDYFLTFYPILYSYVDLRNEVSIKWLNYLGAKWGDVHEVGIDKVKFKYFYFTKE